MLDEDQLEDIRVRAARATPGPWETSYFDSQTRHSPDRYTIITEKHGDTICEIEESTEHEGPHSSIASDAWFIANAREDVPRLLADITQLRAENAALQELISRLGVRLEKHSS